MAGYEYTAKRIFMGRVPYGQDLLNSLIAFVKEKGIRKGQIEVIGALQKAVVGFYNQKAREYEVVTLDHPSEILGVVGNVSVKDGQPFVHAHITLSDERGRAFGGHLMEGTVVFAAEFIIREFEGEDLKRVYEEKTGLALWDM